MSLLDFALSLAGLPQQTINDLDRGLPGFGRLAAAAKEAEPLLEKAKPLLEQLHPIAADLLPIVQRAWPDIVAVTPTIQELIEFANRKG